jgi:putative FmdB family regulatory protein
MPIYEYRCESCGRRFEKLQRLNDPLCTKCPHCGGYLKKIPSPPAIQFKGPGFYITDYSKKSGGGDSEGKSEGKPRGEKSGESGKDAKPAETIPPDKPCRD